jgi:hypothetical protein
MNSTFARLASFSAQFTQKIIRQVESLANEVFNQQTPIEKEISRLERCLKEQQVQYQAQEKTWEEEARLREQKHRAWQLSMIKHKWKHEYAMQRIEAKRQRQTQEREQAFWKSLPEKPLVAPFLFIDDQYGREAFLPFLRLINGFERRWSEELLNASYSDDYSMRDRETKDVHTHKKNTLEAFTRTAAALQSASPSEFVIQCRTFFEQQTHQTFGFLPNGDDPSTWGCSTYDIIHKKRTLQDEQDWVSASVQSIERSMLNQRIGDVQKPSATALQAL